MHLTRRCALPPPWAATASDVYSLVPPEAKGGDGEFWGVQFSKELGKYLAPFVMQARGAPGRGRARGGSKCALPTSR